MPFVDIVSDQHAIHGTHSHGQEGFASAGGAYPAQLKWSDLHPGLKVLPKGAPPAGPGEINWEDTLGGKFALALERLEGLLYAVFGSRPNGNPKRQWYDRQHPRCLWGPETWERRLLMGPPTCYEQGQCWDYQESGKEYAALGESPPCCPLPRPTVPIRSRSGDPGFQFLAGAHDRTVFPLGSVTRDFASEPFDPEGYGWFGATQPGRQDGVGYEYRNGQPVTFRWTRPAGVAAPTTIQLWWKRRLPGSAWSGWDAMTMTPAGDTYSATWEAQPHGTEFRWYIKYFYNDPDPGDPDITKYDPGDDAAPTDEQAYYLQWFTHFNPYIYGLPEMLEAYGGGINVRHGTDFYQFDGGETIQPELIDMCRWILSWFGGDCCGGEFDTCAETDDRSDVFHHNPRFRGGDEGLCCIPMPIRFRWSGSNVHPHYMTGGKGLVGGATPDPRPLHNHPNHKPPVGDAWGSAAARKTWRGINMLYADDTHFDNPFYGGGYSWGTAPGTFVLMYKPNYDELAKVYAKYPSWGLRPGDVIEAVHIKEIVDAVDYLIDYGVWSTINICTRKRTPGQFMGKDCGYHFAENYTQCFGTSGAEWRIACEKCCANADACWPYNHVLGYWYHEWGPGYENSYTEYPDTCESWPTPSWQECTQNCGSAKCHMMARKSGYSQYSPESNPGCPCERQYWEDTVCDGYDPFGQFGGEGAYGCGYHRSEQGCRSWDWELERCVDDPHAGYNCVRRVEGLSYFACTPGKCNRGWDATHGGQFKKNRLDHEYCHGLDCSGLWSKATGPPGNEASGNCLGDMFGCGDTFPGGPDQGLWFQEVTGIYWRGLVPSWYSGCDGMPGCSSDCSFGDTLALPPAIPGYGHHAADGTPLCAQYIDAVSGCFSAWVGYACCTGHICQCSLGDFPVCKGEAAWVAVDLNLDGSGRPYRAFNGRDGGLLPYEGRGVPRLRDYDLTKNPATWMHDCPCETWTGAGTCVI